jgi:uridylate kinase
MMNALALRDMLMASGVKAEALSAKAIDGVLPAAGAHISKKLLHDGNVVIFAGGTGNPFVTTDSAASLRAVEIGADAILKATTVDGVFDADPRVNPGAKKYQHVSFDEVVQKELAVMDLSAFTQCRDYNIPICVFNMEQPENLLKVMSGQNIGTWVSNGDEK